MKRIFKHAFSVVLVALLRRTNGIRRNLAQFWAYVRFASMLDTKLDSSVVVLGVPEVHGTARISLGRNLYLYRELYLETQQQGAIEIGDGVVISRGTHIVSHFGIRIGDGVMIGEYVSIRDANHVMGQDDLRTSGYTGAPIVIGRNAWIGRGVAILAGVTIGDNAVVAANAVVTRDVPANTVVGGVPARPLVRSARPEALSPSR